MSALVASRTSLTTSHPTSSTMDTKSPVSSKKTSRPEVSSDKPSASETSSSSKQAASTNGVKASSPSPPQDSSSKPSTQPTTATTGAEGTKPLAPPPRPSQSNPEGGDYFNNNHGTDSHFSLEPNPFEQSFGVPSADTPGKSLLPPVASLTSPAPLGGNTSSASGFSWTNSLRAGPLSPAMLAGPAAATDYFGNHLRGGFPTPNESSLRTGLTPGGGGSMFPAASPNSQALYNQLASGNATPSTLDFHRTAAAAAASQSKDKPNGNVPHTNGHTSNKAAEVMENTGDSNQAAQSDPFGHDAKDAANGLFLLAHARNGAQAPGQYVAVNQQSSIPSVQPVSGDRNGRNMSGSSESARGMSLDSQDFSEGASNEQTKPNTRNRGKKGSSSAKGAQNSTNGRRKAEDTPSKAPASKKAKVARELEPPDSDDEDVKMEDEQLNENGKKMTDEEKRKNFLERNRVAALKCRQRKKQWLANLQTKVEIFSGENDALSAQVTQLREEIVNLKTLLLAHKDCPVSQAQGLSSMAMSSIGGEYGHHANPYGMAIPNGAQVMAGQQMQRR